MGHRTRDIINLREAARRCRGNAETSQGPRAETFQRLAEEIDGLIQSLSAENEAGRDHAAPWNCENPAAHGGKRARAELTVSG